MIYKHIPVLLKEVVELLDPQPNQNFVDATLGGGGYTKAILDRTSPKGKLLATDLDTEAIENFKIQSASWRTNVKNRVTLVQGNFKDIADIVVHHKFNNIQGIVADIGISSYELDTSGRGISFQKNEPLDMRFDTRGNTVNAAFILNNWSVLEILNILRSFGEEPFAKQIANRIIKTREVQKFHNTKDLVEVIEQSLPKPVKHKWKDSCRRVFQALRIAVNHELENLESFLPKAFDILNPGGKLAVVTFHSLEDRIVKQYFVGLSKGCVCPVDFPECRCGRSPNGKILTKKPVVASEDELKINPRSKSAKLRVIQKI